MHHYKHNKSFSQITPAIYEGKAPIMFLTYASCDDKSRGENLNCFGIRLGITIRTTEKEMQEYLKDFREWVSSDLLWKSIEEPVMECFRVVEAARANKE